MTDKKIKCLPLRGPCDNAFTYLAAFQRQAKIEGWTEAEIKELLDLARSDDYDHLILTIYGAVEN